MQFIKKTSSRTNILGLVMKLTLALVVITISIIIIILGKIDFPSPNEKIEKIIPNEKLKIVK